MGKYVLEVTVFACGATVMIFELVGSRVLGPYLGTSTFVWTTLIGVVMGSLSLGYYWGGRMADKKATLSRLSCLVLAAAISIFVTFLIMDTLLFSLTESLDNVIATLLLTSIILFAPASILLGMISPYAAKLKLSNLKSSGATIGNLYALSTMGSIVGTFLAGFYLIPKFGTGKLLILIALSLAILSLFVYFNRLTYMKMSAVLVLGAFLPFSNITAALYAGNNLVDIDTEYSRVWVFDSEDWETKREVKNLKIDQKNSSSMFLESDELVYGYTKFYDLAAHFKPNFKKSLLLGGAAYSYPKHYLQKYPQAKLDVVEIDPRLTKIAKEHFKLEETENLRIFHEDARVFLNKTKEKYDVIFGDAFGSQYSIPFHLTTKEAIQKNYDALNDDGIVVANIISSIEGRKGEFLRAEYITYKSVFPQVFLFPVQKKDDGDALQNIVLVALKSEEKPTLKSDDLELQKYLTHIWRKKIKADIPVLTDDYAPVAHYAYKTKHTN